MDLQIAKSLIPKLINNTATSIEVEAFDTFITTASYNNVCELLDSYYQQLGITQDANNINIAAISANIEQRINSYETNLSIQPLQVAYTSNKHYWWAAAAILLIMASGYLVMQNVFTKSNTLANVNAISVKPGTNKALLQLDNGKTIVLDITKDSTVQNSNGVALQIHDASLVYQPQPKDAVTSFNTLSTPRGSQYQLVLPDGSKVWLNAASSIRFPTAFLGSKRQVTLTGEAYFEVAKNAKQPFEVLVNDIKVQVLGTHFNIMAYSDEAAITTTLLEGSVKVQHQAQTATLVPGMQAVITANNIAVETADVDNATAWKDGYFSFDKANIQEIMRGIARWYDVEVGFEGKINTSRFKGGIRRSAQLSQVLNVLELSGLHFKVAGEKIIVQND